MLKRLKLDQHILKANDEPYPDTLKDMLQAYIATPGTQSLLPSVTDKGIAYELWKDLSKANGQIDLKETQYGVLTRICDGAGNLAMWSIVATQQVKKMVDSAEPIEDISIGK